ncbi:hypothetical protein BaRGS_00014997 [Batillaria attramentaria]|uniref:Uncharacterized protein n=1 Tax=Batillaria attramentaria TaxID=370345 RepID=A0ABD0L2V5_9CAEN
MDSSSKWIAVLCVILSMWLGMKMKTIDEKVEILNGQLAAKASDINYLRKEAEKHQAEMQTMERKVREAEILSNEINSLRASLETLQSEMRMTETKALGTERLLNETKSLLRNSAESCATNIQLMRDMIELVRDATRNLHDADQQHGERIFAAETRIHEVEEKAHEIRSAMGDLRNSLEEELRKVLSSQRSNPAFQICNVVVEWAVKLLPDRSLGGLLE